MIETNSTWEGAFYYYNELKLTQVVLFSFYIHWYLSTRADENELEYEKLRFFYRKWVKLIQGEIFSIFKSVHISRV